MGNRQSCVRTLLSRHGALALGVCGALLGGVSRAEAVIAYQSRLSDYHLTLPDLATFAGATAEYDAVYSVTADGPTTPFANWFAVRAGYLNYAHRADPPIVLTPDVFNPALSRYEYTIGSSGAGSGSESFHYDTPIALTFVDSWIVSGTANGYQTLEFSGGGFLGSGAPNYVFDLRVVLPGDWSQLGTTTGQLEFLSLDPNWAIVTNFQYDLITNETVFEATNPSATGTNVGPSLNFRLYGAAVPEPTSIVSGFVGLAAMVAIAARRRAAQPWNSRRP